MEGALVPLAPARIWRSVAALCMLGVVLTQACGDGPTDGGHLIPAEIRLLSQFPQAGTPGWPLPDSIVVEVLDAAGNAVPGVPVSWSAANGADVLGRAADTTNIAGRASAEWTLGRNEGQQTLSIVASDLAPVTTTATATILHAASVTVAEGGFACALTDGGQAFCWGRNAAGELGNGTIEERVRVPGPVAGDLVFTSLTAAGEHACGLITGGTAYCWGLNESGETGTGTTGPSVPVPTPVQTTVRFTAISAGGPGHFANSTCGLTAAGEVWCWGDNSLAKLGDGTTSNSAIPVRVQSDVPFSSVHTGFFNACAHSTSGELWCWGEQEVNPGALGGRPAGLYTTPVLLHEDFTFAQLSTGRAYACGLAGQTAFCWGADVFGSLGHGRIDGSAVPLEVVGGHQFKALSAASFEETHGLTTDGVLYRWGSPGGDQTQNTPLRVTDFPFAELDSGGEPFAGGRGACGITAGNAVFCVDDDGLVRGVPAPAVP